MLTVEHLDPTNIDHHVLSDQQMMATVDGKQMPTVYAMDIHSVEFQDDLDDEMDEPALVREMFLFLAF